MMGIFARSWPLFAMAMCAVLAGAQETANPRAAEYNNLGIEAYNGAHYTEAIRYFEKAYELARTNATVRHNLCNALQSHANELAKAGEYTDAVDLLTTAAGVEPENPSPLIQLGSYYLQLDEVQQAIFRLEEAIELKPGELSAHELLGEAYYRDNDLPSARVQWEYVLQVEPARPGLRDRYDKAFREESVENGYQRSGSRHFKISCPKDAPNIVRSRVLAVLERAYLDIGRKMGGVYPPPPIQTVLYGDGEFSEATQLSENVAALYDGKIRAPLMDDTGAYLDGDELTRRLTHEYVHVVVRHVAGGNVPWWLNEGLAETLSKDFGERETALFQQAQTGGQPLSLARLEAHQLQALAPEALSLAYIQSHATVQMLWNRYGQRRLSQLLDALRQGETPQAALRQVYRMTYGSLEQEVISSL